MKPYSHARLSKWTGTAFILIFASLHVLKRDVDPSWNFISMYQLGDFGWLMSVAFIMLAMSSILLALSLWSQMKSVAGKIGPAMLMVTGIGLILAALFKTDPQATPLDQATFTGQIHQLGASLDLIPFAAIVLCFSLVRNNEGWRKVKWVLIVAAATIWIGELFFIANMTMLFPADGIFGPGTYMGWVSRLTITLQAAWLVLLARQATSVILQDQTTKTQSMGIAGAA